MKYRLILLAIALLIQGCSVTLGFGNMVGPANSEGMKGAIAEIRGTVNIIKGVDVYASHTSMTLEEDKGHGIQHAGVLFTIY